MAIDLIDGSGIWQSTTGPALPARTGALDLIDGSLLWPTTIGPVPPPPPPPPPPPREPYRGGGYIPRGKRREVLLSDGSILMVQEIQRTEAYGRVAIISVSRSAAGRQSTTAEGFTYNRQEEEIIILSLLL